MQISGFRLHVEGQVDQWLTSRSDLLKWLSALFQKNHPMKRDVFRPTLELVFLIFPFLNAHVGAWLSKFSGLYITYAANHFWPSIKMFRAAIGILCFVLSGPWLCFILRCLINFLGRLFKRSSVVSRLPLNRKPARSEKISNAELIVSRWESRLIRESWKM